MLTQRQTKFEKSKHFCIDKKYNLILSSIYWTLYAKKLMNNIKSNTW